MVSFKAKVTKAFLYRFINMNSGAHPNRLIKYKNLISKYAKDTTKKGYSVTREKTSKNTKYLVIRKDSNKSPKKVIYFIHGGCFILGIFFIYRDMACQLCDIRDDIEVVLLDYDLAPESKYPTQLNQAYDLWNELNKKYNSNDIIIGGDSAGGNLALSLIHKLKKEQNIAPNAGFFISSWTDMTCSGKSVFENYGKDAVVGQYNQTLTKESWEHSKTTVMYSFIGDADRKDPYISPLFGDFTTFPKSLFVVGGDEMLLDDTLRVVDKIKENNNDVRLIQREGMFHIYPLMMKHFREGREDFDKIRDFIAESFS